uniref:BAH domain-containing protein n=1 Tax=Oryza brachyantha TaxID=4533 RepID=J3LTS2_ORYBR
MAKTRQSQRRLLESFTIKGPDGVIKPGDCVLMKAPESSKKPYVARVEKIEATRAQGTQVKLKVRWYYRPEEVTDGRQIFHGSKEVFLSDHYDSQSVDTIECKCYVHTIRKYTKLRSIGTEDYFCRFEYKSATGIFVPDRVAVFCKCEMPYNPDNLMIQCEDCFDWFHPSCVGMTDQEAKKLENFYCESCIAENEKKVHKPNGATTQSEEKDVEVEENPVQIFKPAQFGNKRNMKEY